VYQCAGDDQWVAIDRTHDPMAADERAAWCATRTPEDAAKEALADGIPAAAMVPGYATLHDPQMRARRFFEPVTHSLVGEQQYPSWPVRMSAGPHTYWQGPAPTLGEHTNEVLAELGIGADEIARLEAEHVIGTTPYMGG
jgi:crotonobetainyl-CoA:carnitine CoA-transferase CaiB-like acyl-CoA transferase